jgi:hypothetical protein
MRRTLWVAGGLWLLLAAGAAAQEPKGTKPGPEHAKLKKIVGTWDATVEMMGKESKGTVTYKMGLGGLWLLEHFKADFDGMKFEGMGATSYDPAKKKYVSVWADSMTPTPMITEGTYDDEGRMVMKGKMTFAGKAVPVTMTSVMKGEDTLVSTMTMEGPDGKEMTFMKITYKRKGG